MTGQVLTEVSAVVAAEHEADLVAAYRDLVARPFPDGLVRTELLSGQDGHWRIQPLNSVDAPRRVHLHASPVLATNPNRPGDQCIWFRRLRYLSAQ
ncbi:hypothetical protein [Streptomyces hokutonensis]|uniref:hypothetical protein n=1 Tax=Streptomyces hokutonensis TaxID=1306990 RepID=UPI0033C30E11